MKATISNDKKTITLENGNVSTIGKDETVADFMSRVRSEVKEEYLEALKIEKEKTEVDDLADDLIKKSNASVGKKAASTKVELTEEQKVEAKKVKDQEIADKAKAKIETDAKKKLAKEEADAAKKAAKEKADEKKAELAAAALEARREELKVKGEEMIAEAETKSVEMVEAAKVKAAEHAERVKAAVEKMIETGSVRGVKGSGTGVRVEPEQMQVDYIDSIVGQHVTFDKKGELITGQITARSIDYRVGIVFARIVSTAGTTHHKSYNKVDELTFIDAPVESATPAEDNIEA